MGWPVKTNLMVQKQRRKQREKVHEVQCALGVLVTSCLRVSTNPISLIVWETFIETVVVVAAAVVVVGAIADTVVGFALPKLDYIMCGLCNCNPCTSTIDSTEMQRN